MKISILDKTKKKKFIAGVEDLGMKKIPELLIRTGRERIRAYSGNLSKEEIMELWMILPFEGIGLYVGKDMVNRSGVREVRLSVDGLHTWKDQIDGNILKLSEEQEELWFRGKNIELDAGQSGGVEGKFVAVQSADGKDLIGTGKLDGEGKVLYGFLPKERRRKN
ncbi:hypothetical protein HOA55_03250 [archaeon]|jgi:NOL1/NOP2/fmu family ribosome biogenesis protein|nr:hypothetical protein [archaeon]MBT3577411.1 hypothetical protein [archaeon]MBT6820346.1 hypothetical protein [archaeon]MBT6956103.1 hypothetical protein [archaeon]MBT7025160.1 hypothetical protein [archaeon]